MNELLQLELPVGARALPPPGTVECWLIPLDSLALPASSAGDHSSRQTLRLRRQFLLRLILGAYLQLPGKDIELVRGPSGKPALAPSLADSGLNFNLSHSGDWLALALASDIMVGVDIEQHRALSRARELGRRYFSPQEADHLETLEEPHRSRRFLELWTVREACIKAMGSSLAQSLRDLALAPDSGEILSLPADWPAAAAWTLQRPALPAPLEVCIAAPEPGLALQVIWLDCGPV